jgi:hypothetical protein
VPTLLTEPAFYSGIAAITSAMTALIVTWIHRRNLIESVRPQLVPIDWARSDYQWPNGPVGERLTFKVRNMGRGLAIGVHINETGDEFNSGRPRYIFPSTRAHVIGVGDALDALVSVLLVFENATSVDPDDGERYISFEIRMVCRDLRGRYHTSTYVIVASSSSLTEFVGGNLAPGVGMGNSSTWIETLGRRRLRAGLKTLTLLAVEIRESMWRRMYRRREH